jgi:class 3 adenylate cyclase/tetratricopeptide (TPR) repeat protein
MDVGVWLRNLGLGRYEQTFAENVIDGDVLGELTEGDLEKLGIPLGDRKRLIKAIRATFAGSVTANTTVGIGVDAQSEQRRVADAERRHLSVMICDLLGSTALSNRLDPEDMRAVMDAYHAACARVMQIYDGFLAEFRGDGILAYFGYPYAHEDDAERTVRAGLDIIAAVARLKTRAGVPLAVRIGIATGLVVVGAISDKGALREHAVVGDTPNIAARLQALAAPGTIVVAASTRRLLGDLFLLRDLGRQKLAGIAEPIAAWAVEGVSDSNSRFEAIRTARLTDLIGRENEIGFLVERKRLAWMGQGRIILISGEPGIGKSRIATALDERIRAESHTRLHYQCSPYHANSALYPFVAQLERAAQIKPDDRPRQKLDKLEAILAMATSRVQAVAPLFAALLSVPFGERYPPLALSPTQQRRQTFAALLDQLEGLAHQKPIFLLFEDMQWADATSRELLDLIVERVRQLPVFALFTFRPEFEPPWVGLPNVDTLTLGRLDRSNVESMIMRVTRGRALASEVTEQIVAKTDGNPLFVEELTKAVLEAGILVETAEGYQLNGPLPSLAIPATLHDSLMARLDRLASVKEVGQIGAAIGREFSYSLLRVLVDRGETALKDALTQIEHAGLIFRRGEPPEAIYTFKHALVQDAAYESLLKSRRQVLHQRIAGALRDRFPTMVENEPEVVAHHFTQAGLTQAAVEWWAKAGERALDRSAYDEAVAHLEKAIAVAQELTDGSAQSLLRLRVQTTYGYALLHGRGMAALETIAAFARARELATGVDDAGARFSAYYGLWTVSMVRSDLPPMREVVDAFLSDARYAIELPAPGRLLVLGVTCWFEGDYVGARMHLEQALAAYDPERDRHLPTRFGFDVGVAAMGRLALVLWPLGKVEKRTNPLDTALTLSLQRGHIPTVALTRYFTCLFAAIRKRPARAAEHADALIAMAREHGLQYWLAAGTFWLGWSRWWNGDREGETEMREGLALMQKVNYHICGPLFGTLLAEVEAESGRPEDGLATLDAQITAIEQTGERWFYAEVYRMRAELLLKQHPPNIAAAELAFLRAIEISRDQQTKTFELRAALALAKMYRTTDRHDAVREFLVPALAGFDACGDVPEVEEAEWLLTLNDTLRAG